MTSTYVVHTAMINCHWEHHLLFTLTWTDTTDNCKANVFFPTNTVLCRQQCTHNRSTGFSCRPAHSSQCVHLPQTLYTSLSGYCATQPGISQVSPSSCYQLAALTNSCSTNPLNALAFPVLRVAISLFSKRPKAFWKDGIGQMFKYGRHTTKSKKWVIV